MRCKKCPFELRCACGLLDAEDKNNVVNVCPICGKLCIWTYLKGEKELTYYQLFCEKRPFTSTQRREYAYLIKARSATQSHAKVRVKLIIDDRSLTRGLYTITHCVVCIPDRVRDSYYPFDERMPPVIDLDDNRRIDINKIVYAPLSELYGSRDHKIKKKLGI